MLLLSAVGVALVVLWILSVLYAGPALGAPPTILCPSCTGPSALSLGLPALLSVAGASLLAYGLPLDRGQSRGSPQTASSIGSSGFLSSVMIRTAVFLGVAGAGIAFLGTQLTVSFGCAPGLCIPPDQVWIPWELFAGGIALVGAGSVLGLFSLRAWRRARVFPEGARGAQAFRLGTVYSISTVLATSGLVLFVLGLLFPVPYACGVQLLSPIRSCSTLGALLSMLGLLTFLVSLAVGGFAYLGHKAREWDEEAA